MSRYSVLSSAFEAKFAKERYGVLTSTPTLQRRGSRGLPLWKFYRVEWRIVPNDHFECPCQYKDDRGTVVVLYR